MSGENKTQGKGVQLAGSVSGAGSIISAHNICHYLCLGVVALLSVFGIIVSSDILMWLENYNLLFWSMGLVFFFVGLFLFYRKPCCISEKTLLFNAGLLSIGFPFFRDISLIFQAIGILASLSATVWFLAEKFGGVKWIQK